MCDYVGAAGPAMCAPSLPRVYNLGTNQSFAAAPYFRVDRATHAWPPCYPGKNQPQCTCFDPPTGLPQLVAYVCLVVCVPRRVPYPYRTPSTWTRPFMHLTSLPPCEPPGRAPSCAEQPPWLSCWVQQRESPSFSAWRGVCWRLCGRLVHNQPGAWCHNLVCSRCCLP